MYLIKATYEGAVPGNMPKRELNRILKWAWWKVCEKWHAEMLPEHFTIRGARKYGYKLRVGERGNTRGRSFASTYTGRKLREHQHTRPMVWSGDSEKRAMIRDVRATSKGVKILPHAPRLNYRNPRTKNPQGEINMRDEYRAITDDERRELIEYFGDLVQQGIERYKRRTEVSIEAA